MSSTIDLTSDSEDDNDRKPSAKDKQEGVIAIVDSSDDDSITARKKRSSTGVASTTRPKKKKRIDPPPTLSSTAMCQDVSTSTDLETNRKRKGSPSSLNDDDVEIVEVPQVKKKRRKGGCGGCDAHRQQLNAEQLKEQEDMERVTYQDDEEDDDDDDDEVIVVNGRKQAAVLTAEELHKSRDKCIRELKAEQKKHTTDTGDLSTFLVSVIRQVAECRRKGLHCRLPVLGVQCATATHSVGNGGRCDSGSSFEDNSSCRNASILLRMLPRDVNLGFLPAICVNAWDKCPVGTFVDGKLIIKCPIWIIIIAMERAALINIFAKHAKEMGANLFLGGIGGTSTGVKLFYRYIEFEHFDVVTPPGTHISNASTPRWRPGWGWPSWIAQVIRVTTYFKLLSEGLVRFYRLSRTTLSPTPLQAMINHQDTSFVRDLSTVSQSYMMRWAVFDRPLTKEEKTARYCARSTLKLSEEAIAARIASGSWRQTPGGELKRVCIEEGCDSFARIGGLCIKHGAQVKPKPKCKIEGCNNQAQKQGLCIKHGAQVKARPKCKIEGCNSDAQKQGLCIKHGAQVKPKPKCKIEGCNNQAQKQGLCIKHGAPVKERPKCKIEGCNSYARGKDGVCTKHGSTSG